MECQNVIDYGAIAIGLVVVLHDQGLTYYAHSKVQLPQLECTHYEADTRWFSMGLWVEIHFHLESGRIGGKTKIAKSQWLNFTLYFHLDHYEFLQLE